MKIIYNDATEIAVQQVEPYGDYLRILIIGTTPEQIITSGSPGHRDLRPCGRR